LPAVDGVNLDPDEVWLRATATRPPNWPQSPPLTIVDLTATRFRGGGNE
jgi:hypothetical protein